MNRLVAALFAVLALTAGCTAKVSTTVEVTGEDTAEIRVGATFTGEAADVLASDAAARAGLVDLFRSRSGQSPVVDVTGDRVQVGVTVDYDQLPDLAEVTGVTSLTLTNAGTRLEVGYGPATRLTEAIAEQNAAEPDAEALTATMLDATTLAVVVVFPGGVNDVTGADDTQVTVDGTDAVFTRDVSDTTQGTLVVTGDHARSWWPWVGGGMLVAGGVVWWFRRRR